MPGFSPGFMINAIGDGPSNDVNPFMNYTWGIESLFEQPFTNRSPLIFLRDCTFPTFTAGREEIEGSNLKYKVASTVVWEDVRVTFYDIPISGITLADTLKAWRRKVWNPITGLGAGDEYKLTSRLLSFTADWSMYNTWELINSWPQQIREGELTYTNSNVKIVDVVVCYDWAEVNPSGSANNDAYEEDSGYIVIGRSNNQDTDHIVMGRSK